jgi:hypothetical protein
MPFYDEWNPDKGGSYQAGADWIIANIGKRPEGCTIDVIKHELGFVPGNLRWAPPKGQAANKMYKRLADLEDLVCHLLDRYEPGNDYGIPYQ